MAKKILNEEQVSSLIYRMVKESLEAMPSNFDFEENSSDNSGNSQNSGNESNDFKRKRLQIQKFFSQDGVNPAAYAYNLFDVEPVEGNDTNEMKNARSLFMKKLHNEQNQDGSTYDFTSEEVNALHSLISGDKISEGKNSKVLMNEEQFNEFIGKMVTEAVNRILKEWQTDPDTGTDEFWSEMDPNVRPRTLKDIESDESWDEFDDENGFVPSVGLANAGTRKNQTAQDVDDALSIRNGEKYWNKRELANRDKMMSKYIDGSRDEDDIDDAWFGIHS